MEPLKRDRKRISGVYKLMIFFQDNVSVVGLSGSEVSDSGLTSEDEDSRVRKAQNLMLLRVVLCC